MPRRGPKSRSVEVRTCIGCGNPIPRRMVERYGKLTLESPYYYRQRKYCSDGCRENHKQEKRREAEDLLIEQCRQLYNAEGIQALTCEELGRHKLYQKLIERGLTQAKVIEVLGLEAEYRAYYAKHVKAQPRWTWEMILEEVKRISGQEGFVPTLEWFQNNDYASLGNAVNNSGHTWAELREALGDFRKSAYVASRNRKQWRSRAEAALSNYLYARGVPHREGRRYSRRYAEQTPYTRATYDMAIRSQDDSWIDVEVWANFSPSSERGKQYARKRAAKERFNRSNPHFLGIEYEDCYDESKLDVILEPFIGQIEPYIFDKPTDREVSTTRWSDVDELLETCRDIASKQPDGKFPSHDWLLKRGKWKEREGEPYFNLADCIWRWVGGNRRLRKLMKQEQFSNEEWDREKALQEYSRFYERHGMSPATARGRVSRGKLDLGRDEYELAARIMNAARQYVGSAARVHEILGLPNARTRGSWKWNQERARKEYKKFFSKYGRTPDVIIKEYQAGHDAVSEEDYRLAISIRYAAEKFLGGTREAHRILGLPKPKRQR